MAATKEQKAATQAKYVAFKHAFDYVATNHPDIARSIMQVLPPTIKAEIIAATKAPVKS